MTFQVILYIKNPQKKGEKLYGDKMERADNRKSVGRNLFEYPVYFIKREITFGGNGKMGKVYL